MKSANQDDIGGRSVRAIALNIHDTKFLSILVIIRRETRQLNMNEITHIETGQILTIEFGDIAMARMGYTGRLFDIISDVLPRHIIQFIRRQIEIPSEIGIHINLETPRNTRVSQVIFATGNHEFRVFYAEFAVPIYFATHFANVSRKRQEIALTVIFLGTAKHELIIKAEDVIPDNDIGILLLDQLRPFYQEIRFILHRINDDSLNRVTRTHD